MDDVQATLAEITALVEGARAMPMSASCVVNRSDLLALLDGLREQLPASLQQAQAVLGDADGVVEQGRQEAARLVQQAHEERRQLVAETAVHAEAAGQAAQVLEQARAAAEDMRLEVEDYVDAKLANFEIVLTKTLSAVERGRAKLAGRNELADLGEDEPADSFLGEPSR